MNLTRLMALGILARSGPSHGHHIRRVAELTDVGEWGGVSVGALYRELRAMEREGLVEAMRTEKVGNRPERTVYAITDEGRLELTALREQAIKPPLASGPDPFGVALLFAADGVDREELRRTLRARREMLAIWAAEMAAEREGLVAKGYLDVLAAAVMRRGIVHAEAEVRWHDELDATLAAPGGETPAGSLGGGSFEVAAPRRTALEVVAGAAGGASAEGRSADRAPAEPARGDAAADAGGPRRGRTATRREKPRQ
jgi:DNA-binding PadR family transcriptional regulator